MNASNAIRAIVRKYHNEPACLTNEFIIDRVACEYGYTVTKQHVHNVAGSYWDRGAYVIQKSTQNLVEELFSRCDGDMNVVQLLIKGYHYNEC